MTAPSLAIAVLTTGERVPLTDSIERARRLLADGGYDNVTRIETADSETPGSASPEPMPVATVQLALI